MISIDAMFDELEKLAARLNEQERRAQAGKFTALGAAAVPAVTGLTNLISEGRVVPKGIKPGRWIAGQAVGGAIAGGALPSIRHHIERSSQEQAKSRLRAAREAREAARAG